MNNNIEIDDLFNKIKLTSPSEGLNLKIMARIEKAAIKKKRLAVLYSILSIIGYLLVMSCCLWMFVDFSKFNLLESIEEIFSTIGSYWMFIFPVLFFIGLDYLFYRLFRKKIYPEVFN